MKMKEVEGKKVNMGKFSRPSGYVGLTGIARVAVDRARDAAVYIIR